MTPPRAKQILRFWFGTPKDAASYLKARNRLWFGGDPKTDKAVKRRFEKDLNRAVRGRLKHWPESPEGTLALIILLDQFSLQRYYGRASVADGWRGEARTPPPAICSPQIRRHPFPRRS